jgi:uncharacterized delta-60 repeat protein
MKRWFTKILRFAISLLALSPIAAAQTQLPAGSLDASFGSQGKLALRHAYDAKLSAVAIQADGKIVVTGAIYPLFYKSFFTVARFNSNGSLDESFGSNGMVITRFETYTFSASAIAIQPDGKIVVTGDFYGVQPNGSHLEDFVVLRLNSDGSPDTGFGKNGEAITDFGLQDASKALLLQPDGKIVVGGSTSISRPDLELARYNPDGSLDKTFNSTGMVVTPNNNGADSFNAMVLQADGKIVVAGNKYTSKDTDGLLIRYNRDGSIDQSFGVDGRVITDFGTFDYIRNLQVQSDGKILVAGSQRKEYFAYDGAGIILGRFNSNGSLDPSFANNGKLIATFNNYAEAYSAVVQSDGKILIAGTTGPGDPNYSYSLLDFLAVRYNPDGTLDNDFGDGGKVITDFGRLERARAAAIDAKGNIVLAGYTGDYTWDGFDQADFALARYIGVSPKPLPDFALAAESATLNAARGSKVKLKININRLHGFDGNVVVSAPDTSNLKIVIPEPMVTVSGASAEFTLKIKKAPLGTQALLFTGRDAEGHERSTTINLVIQ